MELWLMLESLCSIELPGNRQAMEFVVGQADCIALSFRPEGCKSDETASANGSPCILSLGYCCAYFTTVSNADLVENLTVVSTSLTQPSSDQRALSTSPYPSGLDVESHPAYSAYASNERRGSPALIYGERPKRPPGSWISSTHMTTYIRRSPTHTVRIALVRRGGWSFCQLGSAGVRPRLLLWNHHWREKLGARPRGHI
ncbi:hypothetical protein OH77DRAFT_1416140 [Trametes cingulata]|nr:hypothetical protein OH77DRAFT_1416140 [Trametes cingulata]